MSTNEKDYTFGVADGKEIEANPMRKHSIVESINLNKNLDAK